MTHWEIQLWQLGLIFTARASWSNNCRANGVSVFHFTMIICLIVLSLSYNAWKAINLPLLYHKLTYYDRVRKFKATALAST